jgi:transcriptional regulator with XRE-family HTH domain
LRVSPTARGRRLALELRQLREDASLTIEQVAAELECSVSKVSRIETGHVRAAPRDVRDMLALYKVNGGRRETLIQLARDAREKGWWTGYGETAARIDRLIGLETEAALIQAFEVLLVPGLLQIAEYARAIMRAVGLNFDDEAIERHVELRLARQSRLLDADDPPTVQAVLDEAVLHRTVGGREVMRKQLGLLLERARLPNVEIRVLPFDQGEHAWMVGGFTLHRFEDGTPDVVYLESREDDTYVQDPIESKQYADGFAMLWKRALGSKASARFIDELRSRPTDEQAHR